MTTTTYGGYGGFMGTSTGLPNSSTLNSSAQNSPMPFGSPSGKKNNDPSMRHVTVKQIYDAKEVIPDSPCVLDGRPLGTLYIIGRINKVTEQSTHVRYMVDDGTGTIEVSKWADNKEGMEADEEAASREALVEGVYVRIIGVIRIFQKKKTIMAHHINLVDNMDQITYHNLMALYTQTYLNRPMGGFPMGSMGSMGSGMQGMQGFPGGAQQPLYNSNPLPDQPSMYSPLQEQVLQNVKALDNGANIDGVKFQDIVFKMRGVASELDIRACLDTLYNDGRIYTTSDDDTFKLT